VCRLGPLHLVAHGPLASRRRSGPSPRRRTSPTTQLKQQASNRQRSASHGMDAARAAAPPRHGDRRSVRTAVEPSRWHARSPICGRPGTTPALPRGGASPTLLSGSPSSDVGEEGLLEDLRTVESVWASPNHLAGATRLLTPKVTEVRRGSAHGRAAGVAKRPGGLHTSAGKLPMTADRRPMQMHPSGPRGRARFQPRTALRAA
jgi:hypothetical protein